MKTFISFLFVVFTFSAIAQKQANIWYFGLHAGLDFNSGSPVPITNGQTKSPDLTTPECSSIISDSSGSLLFYTDGQTIWNKNQHPMPNGDSLYSDFSSTQGALIVPQPGSSRYFYVFTVDDFYKDNIKYGFRYSVVDICADSGLGDVIVGQKNILLLDTVCEKLAAIRHANGTDYWIIVHKFYSDAFYSYHLTATGITDTVITHIGSMHPNSADTYQGTGSTIGQMKASPDGTKLAIVNGNNNYTVAEYFDFDNSNGTLNSWVNLQTNTTLEDSYYGVSFSPDNSKLYIAGDLNANGIFQFDLNAGSATAIAASKTNIASINYNYFALQLAPDGKIYVTRSPNIGIPALDVINYPDSTGLSCGYQSAAIYLNGDSAGEGLPNFITGFDYSNTIYKCSNPNVGIDEIADGNISVYPNPSTAGWQLTVSTDMIGAAINIYDVDGSVVYHSDIIAVHSEIRTDISAGFYWMQINTTGSSIVKKLIKL